MYNNLAHIFSKIHINEVNQSSRKAQNRIPYIDTAKSICILLMVIGHWTKNELLLTYIYSFHMPAFFVISGYLFKPRYWLKTILSFWIPIFFFSLIHFIYLYYTGEISVAQSNPRAIFNSVVNYRYGLEGICLFVGVWFLWALMGLRFLFGDTPVGRITRKWYILIASFSVVYVSLDAFLIDTNSLFRGWFIGCKTFQCIPFFCFGLYLKDSGWNPRVKSISIVISLFMLSVTIPLINGKCGILETEFGLSYILYTLGAILNTILLFVITNIIPENKFCKIISKGTLLVLGSHMPLLCILSKCNIVPDCLNWSLPFIVIFLCYYPIKLLDRWCPILLGKIK